MVSGELVSGELESGELVSGELESGELVLGGLEKLRVNWYPVEGVGEWKSVCFSLHFNDVHCPPVFS